MRSGGQEAREYSRNRGCMVRAEVVTLMSLTLDDKSIDCTLAVLCTCHEDPRSPWQGVLVGSSIGGPDWTDRMLSLTGQTEDGRDVRTEVVIDPVRLPSGDLRLRGAGALIVESPAH